MNIGAYDNRWCAVQVKPRHERMVSAILHAKGYEEFLPTYRANRQWSDRRKQIESPLFTGYVFCRLNSKMGSSIVTTAGVVRIVSTGKEIAVIDDREIEAIRLISKAGVNVEPCAYAKIGDRVRVTSGPLTGLEGVVTGYKNQQRLILSVDLIQNSVSAEVNGYNLIPVVPNKTQQNTWPAAFVA